jgi:UDP-N-acetylglucosamine diphosphorylase / glucose-1-phosphate thymidylyltransferase / UDP-N-acetylgalactosamine diphosphorylase / glucosamine-1-phosphate N-acetyltransferase / galactosamine-1-phosphate N-acetyltransferase
MHVVIFEGYRWDRFAPISLARPVFDTFSGMTTLLDKQVRHLQPNRLTLWVRPAMVPFCRKHIIPMLNIPTEINQPLDDEPALVISGRTFFVSRYEPPDQESVVVDEGGIIRMAYVKRPGLNPDDVLKRTKVWTDMLELPEMMQQARLSDYLWDLISWNEEALLADSLTMMDCRQHLPAGPYHLINEENVCVSDDVKIAPGCVLDATRGPIALSRGVSIGANSVISGPCFIGEYSRVAPLTVIRSGTSIGRICRVGGEISNSIISSYSNKAHEGYLGDSYVGQWVNLGAGTTTSNVKNTWGEVAVTIGSRELKTGRRSLGSIIGDHTTSSIGTRLTTGCYVGFNCLLAGSGLVPKFVPTFSFWTQKGMERFDNDKASEVARRMYDRRDRVWTELDDQLMRYAADAARAVEQ